MIIPEINRVLTVNDAEGRELTVDLYEVCPDCQGTGRCGASECTFCKGKGFHPNQNAKNIIELLSVSGFFPKLPAGIFGLNRVGG